MNIHRTVLCLIWMALCTAAGARADGEWIDISSAQIAGLAKQPWPGGCAGVAVNRLNGDVLVNIVGHGLWKSSNQGESWTRLDGGAVSGRGECGWSIQIDQNDPRRVAVFSLDGDAGYTVDGVHWKKFASLGRNWDFGSVDWGSPAAQVILAGKHESDGEVYKSADGGSTWAKLPIVMDPVRKKDQCMIGVMNAETFIYSYANGIQRSTDSGATWSQVSELQPRSKIPVLFKGAHYLCTSSGLIASRDLGATWQVQGASIDIWQGPFFGANEKNVVAAGPQGIYKTADGGASWAKVSDLRPNVNQNFSFGTNWFGCYAWDGLHDVVYATAMSHPAFKKQLGSQGDARGRDAADAFQPLENAHAHNDYLHERPLLDALERGFTSVEADVFLVNGRLLVAHEPSGLRPERTLESLYLDPLRERVRTRNGWVFDKGRALTLLIDIKSDGETTYAALDRVLAGYAEMLTTVENGVAKPKAVTVIVSGNRPRETIAAQKLRYAGIDGRLSDLDSDVASHLLPLISDNWRTHFRWQGTGPLPAEEREKLLSIVQQAHAHKRRVRFWATPEKTAVWKALRAAGVDLIGTDDLDALKEFLSAG